MSDAQSLVIRRYELRDHDAVFELHNLALNAIGAHAGNGPWDDDLHNVDAVYIQAGGEFLVGCLGDDVVAMGALLPTGPGRAELKRMRVHPQRQRLRLGQSILAALEVRARELSLAHVHLETTTLQTAAQAFYERNGYVQTGTGRYEQFDLLIYEKDLAQSDGIR